MARNLFSGVRSVRALARRRNSLTAPLSPSFSTPSESLAISHFLRPCPSLPVFSRPRFVSDLSAVTVTEDESRNLDSYGEKNDSEDDTSKIEKNPVFESLGVESKSSSSETEEFGRTDSGKAVKKIKKKPLHQFFTESVGLTPKTDEIDGGDVEEPKDQELRKGIEEMKKNLRELEEKVKEKVISPKNLASKVKGDVIAPKNLASLFGSSDSLRTEKRKPQKVKVRASDNRATQTSELINSKELSPLLVSFVERLIEEGHMKKANFLKDGKLDPVSLCTHYARDFVKSAAVQFGMDHQEVAKWISGSELKKVALMGCPQIDRKTAYSAKWLRSFFEIQESTVCEGCKLNHLCSFKNAEVPKRENLPLGSALRVLTCYAMMSVHPELQVTEETKESVSKLLEEVLKLTK